MAKYAATNCLKMIKQLFLTESHLEIGVIVKIGCLIHLQSNLETHSHGFKLQSSFNRILCSTLVLFLYTISIFHCSFVKRSPILSSSYALNINLQSDV